LTLIEASFKALQVYEKARFITLRMYVPWAVLEGQSNKRSRSQGQSEIIGQRSGSTDDILSVRK